MGVLKQIIELSSPDSLTDHEEITGAPQICNYCHGNGWFLGCNEKGEGVEKQCPLCLGTGAVQADITIIWRKAECKK
jgi:DnaJ-class molecular chaperone